MARLTAEQVVEKLLRDAALCAGFAGDDTELGRRFASSVMRLEEASELVRSNLIESPDERRARFEAWFAREHPCLSLARDGDGYLYDTARDFWAVWSASHDFRGDA